jgi:hypothetical protein
LQYLFDHRYVNMRSAMSHAKSGRKVLLPQDEAERTDVTPAITDSPASTSSWTRPIWERGEPAAA